MVEAGVEFLPGMRKRPTMDATLPPEKKVLQPWGDQKRSRMTNGSGVHLGAAPALLGIPLNVFSFVL